MTIAPDASALLCQSAQWLPRLTLANVKEAQLRDIWFDSDGFNRYRSTGWMKEPSASCVHNEGDLGGCRCQAYMLARDAESTDPMCRLSGSHCAGHSRRGGNSRGPRESASISRSCHLTAPYYPRATLVLSDRVITKPVTKASL